MRALPALDAADATCYIKAEPLTPTSVVWDRSKVSISLQCLFTWVALHTETSVGVAFLEGLARLLLVRGSGASSRAASLTRTCQPNFLLRGSLSFSIVNSKRERAGAQERA